jgi:type IV pilus assembly protein PilE
MNAKLAHRLPRARGVTLLEVLVTVAIVAVLTAVALPMYAQYLVRGQRATAKTALLQLSQSMERYYTACGSYSNSTSGPCAGTTSTVAYPLAATVSGSTCNAVAPAAPASASYCLTGTAPASGLSFLLSATPCGDGTVTCPAPANTSYVDSTCDVLQLDNTGTKTINLSSNPTVAAQCWQQ